MCTHVTFLLIKFLKSVPMGLQGPPNKYVYYQIWPHIGALGPNGSPNLGPGLEVQIEVQMEVQIWPHNGGPKAIKLTLLTEVLNLIAKLKIFKNSNPNGKNNS